jgi:hypothetical protein
VHVFNPLDPNASFAEDVYFALDPQAAWRAMVAYNRSGAASGASLRFDVNGFRRPDSLQWDLALLSASRHELEVVGIVKPTRCDPQGLNCAFMVHSNGRRIRWKVLPMHQPSMITGRGRTPCSLHLSRSHSPNPDV